MKNINLRALLSAVCVASILGCFTRGVTAAPIRFDEVVQVVNARPAQAQTATFSTLIVAGGYTNPLIDDDDDKKKQQDGRVITTTTSDILKDEPCDCVDEVVKKRGFPMWALLGLAAIPIAWILIKRGNDSPTPTASIPVMTPTPGITPSPTGTPIKTPTPGITPSPTGSPHKTPTPPGMTPTPTPPGAVPEPMTILLFGTGLASIGLAARRRFGKKGESEDEKEEE